MPVSSIVVPCFNESANLPQLIARFEQAQGTRTDVEVVLVDNGSTDDTPAVLARELAKEGRSFIRVVTVPQPNVGYGHGILTGLRAATGQFLAWTHADGQTPPSDAYLALEVLQRSADPTHTFVKGRRKGRPLGDRVFTFGMQAVASTLLREPLADINAQPKAFPRGLLDLATDPPHDLSLDVYVYWLALRNGFAVRTFDVRFGVREHGDSRWAFNWRSKMRHTVRSVRFMAQLARRG